MTESNKRVMGVASEALLQSASACEFRGIFGIMSEFLEATERLATSRPGRCVLSTFRKVQMNWQRPARGDRSSLGVLCEPSGRAVDYQSAKLSRA